MPPGHLGEPPSARRSVRATLLAGIAAGAIAAAAAGVVDGLWSWSRLAQFVPDDVGKLRLLVYQAASHGLAGGLVGATVAATALLFLRATRIGDLVRFAGTAHQAARDRHPGDAVIGLSLVLVGVPIAAGVLALTQMALVPALAQRKHIGLVIASAMGATLVALAAAALITFLVARPVEWVLRRAAGVPALRPLSSVRAPLYAIAILLAVGGAIAAAASFETLRQLHLRPAVVILVAVGLGAGTWPLGVRLADGGGALRRWRWGAIAATAILLAVLTIAAGGRAAVIKAATAHTGLGGYIARGIGGLADLDGDGHSRWLGGGDCDDGDASVHPGAAEIPDDGIDQNCVGGDSTTTARKRDSAFAPLPPAVPADLNLVLITIDTLRADHLGTYGYDRATSPALDHLGREGVVFENAWAHAPSTRYSIPALLTGRLPLDVFYDHSVQGWPGLSPRATTLAELLTPIGVVSGAIVNYWYFDESRRMNQGFASYDNQNARLHQGVSGQGPAHTRGSSSREQTDKAIAFVKAHQQQRFFLWVHYYDPHFEYERHPGTTSFGDRPVDLYDQEIRFTDDHVARLLAALEDQGLWERTAIIVTGDHGEGFGEHGIDLHGYHLYAAQTKVPLIMRVPGIAPRRAKTPAGHIDVAPTVANLMGAPDNPDLMGRSLVDVLGGAEVERAVFQQLSYEGNHEMRAAVDGRCHVIYNVSPATSWEVYRVDLDPRETVDRVDAGECTQLRAELARWYDQSRVPQGAIDALLPAPPSIAAPLDVDLGDAVRLLAVDLPAQVRPGASFDLTLTFAARGRIAAGWRFFGHFEDGRGGRFTGDHTPVRPFEWWKPGDHVRYSVPVVVPRSTPPGRYALWAGLWRGQERAIVRAPSLTVTDRRARVGEIEVVR